MKYNNKVFHLLGSRKRNCLVKAFKCGLWQEKSKPLPPPPADSASITLDDFETMFASGTIASEQITLLSE